MTDEPTTRELDRRLDRIDRAIEAGFAKIETRLDKMVTGEMFAMAQKATEQRLASLEGDITRLSDRVDLNRDHLQGEIDGVEKARAEDRRMLIKAFIAATATLIAAVLGVLLPLMLG